MRRRRGRKWRRGTNSGTRGDSTMTQNNLCIFRFRAFNTCLNIRFNSIQRLRRVIHQVRLLIMFFRVFSNVKVIFNTFMGMNVLLRTFLKRLIDINVNLLVLFIRCILTSINCRWKGTNERLTAIHRLCNFFVTIIRFVCASLPRWCRTFLCRNLNCIPFYFNTLRNFFTVIRYNNMVFLNIAMVFNGT